MKKEEEKQGGKSPQSVEKPTLKNFTNFLKKVIDKIIIPV